MSFRIRAARAAALPLVFGGLILAAAAAKAPSAQPPLALAATYQTGVATWYGPGFEGQRTACGQIYRSSDYTAASNTLACGSVVTVANLDTGDAVAVTITDRGAFTYPIVVDLSHAAFSAIGDPYHGVIRVSVAE
jgi:rare lipoprotein A